MHIPCTVATLPLAHTSIMDEGATVEQEFGGGRGGRTMLLGGARGAALEGAAVAVETALVVVGG